MRALERKLSDEQRYEAELQIALTKREEAALIMADPALYTPADLPPGLRLQVQEADSAAAAPPAAVALPESLQVQRDKAQGLLQEAAAELDGLRKRAAKLGVELDLRIERAVTIALQGDPDEALAELDQIVRTEPRSAVGAKGNYEIGEIHRRLGRWSKAQEGYDAAARAATGSAAGQTAPRSATAQLALKKSTAIRARTAALDKLRDAPEARRRWRVARGLEAPQPGETVVPAGADSLHVLVEIEKRFEEMASEFLHVAEIDLFELGQPRLALYECQQLLADYAGSTQCPRAALGIGWIYDQYLSEPLLALRAYDDVIVRYPEAPQAQQARELGNALRQAMTEAQEEAASQP
jgi:tetratricopeptide (TPR) repeat protein